MLDNVRWAVRLKDVLKAVTSGADRNAAADVARQAMTSTPPPSLAVRQLAAQVLATCGAHGEAVASFRAVYVELPGAWRLAGSIAASYMAMGQPDEALPWALRAAREAPLLASAQVALFSAATGAGRDDYAEAALQGLNLLGEESLVDEVAKGGLLWRKGRSGEATEIFRRAFARGRREPGFLTDFLGLLSGECHYADVVRIAETLQGQAPQVAGVIEMLSGHAKLALRFDRDAERRRARDREAGPRWLSAEALIQEVKRRISRREAFSFIRLGDGEARFTVRLDETLQIGLEEKEVTAIGDLVWNNWFGKTLRDNLVDHVEDLFRRYTLAVCEADVLGVTHGSRMTSDTGHYGYLAAQEAWLRSLQLGQDQLYTDALVPHRLQQISPFLGDVLAGLEVLGVISPHPDLAAKLKNFYNLSAVVSHVLPGEGRLPTHVDARRLEAAFPDAFHRILGEIDPPSPGTVYLVAAGLLGKVFCSRIKALGGIALDVGSIVDGWMGFNTRPGQLDGAATLP